MMAEGLGGGLGGQIIMKMGVVWYGISTLVLNNKDKGVQDDLDQEFEVIRRGEEQGEGGLLAKEPRYLSRCHERIELDVGQVGRVKE
jgi:hypothetical protein